MKRVIHVAKTEILEHRRQPWMLVILTVNYLILSVFFIGAIELVNMVAESPEVLAMVAPQIQGLDPSNLDTFIEGLLQAVTFAFGAMLFTNMPLFVAIMSGYSVLHDRTHGTLPFLMLAPLSRYQLLLGKLLGALAIPLILHVVGVGLTTLGARQIDVMASFADRLGGSTAWWIAFALGAPASALLVGALGTVISALSRDVRTSMQFTSFFIGWLSLAFGFVLVDQLDTGVGMQLAFAVGCTVLALGILFVGSRIMSRELSS